MDLNLPDLRISTREIEQLSGLEVTDRWVGSLLGGTYRFSRLQSPPAWAGWLLFEVMVITLLFIFTLPIGLAVARFSPASSSSLIIASMGVATIMGTLCWYGYRWRNARLLQTFLHLVDEIDRYHAVLNAVEVLTNLQDLRVQPQHQGDAAHLQETLALTRDGLVIGLRTERIFRERLGGKAQLHNSLTQLEDYLSAMQTLELEAQADEYVAVLHQTLQIGHAVRAELAQLSSQPGGSQAQSHSQ
jgi:hypothetical protein